VSVSVVQNSAVVTGGSLGSSGHITLTLNGVSAGNTLILLVTYSDSSSNATRVGAITDTNNNNWNNGVAGDAQATESHSSVTIYSAYNVAAGNTTVTVPNNSASTNGAIAAVLIEITGVATSLVLDAATIGTAEGASTGPVTAVGGTPTSTGDLQFVAMEVNNSGNTGLSTPAGWTSLGFSLSNFPAYGFAYIAPGTSAQSPSYGTLNTGEQWAIATAAYRQAGTTVNTYSRIIQANNNNDYDAEIWWCQSISVSSGTFTLYLPTNIIQYTKNLMAFVAEVSGITAIDQKASILSSGQVASLTVTNPTVDSGSKDFVAAVLSGGYGIASLSNPPTTGYTDMVHNTGGADLGYRINSSALTDSASWTWTNNEVAGAALASFLSNTGATLVQSATAAFNTIALTITLGATPSLGNAIVIGCAMFGGTNGYTFSQIYDNQGSGGGGGGGSTGSPLLLLGVGAG
jgi:hypothetical protein